MNRQHSMKSVPFAVAMVVAVFGVGGLLLVDLGPWSKAHVQIAGDYHPTTKATANAVGARVTPTAPASRIEPDAPEPKPVQPANPVSQ